MQQARKALLKQLSALDVKLSRRFHCLSLSCPQKAVAYGGLIVGSGAGLLGSKTLKWIVSVSDRSHMKERMAARLRSNGTAWPLQMNSNSEVSELPAFPLAARLCSWKGQNTLLSNGFKHDIPDEKKSLSAHVSA